MYSHPRPTGPYAPSAGPGVYLRRGLSSTVAQRPLFLSPTNSSSESNSRALLYPITDGRNRIDLIQDEVLVFPTLHRQPLLLLIPPSHFDLPVLHTVNRACAVRVGAMRADRVSTAMRSQRLGAYLANQNHHQLIYVVIYCLYYLISLRNWLRRSQIATYPSPAFPVSNQEEAEVS